MQRARPGTSLIELLIGIALFFVIVAVSSAMTIDTWKNYFALRDQSQLRTLLTDASDRFQSMLVTATSLPATATIDTIVYTAGASTLIAEIPAINADGTQLSGIYDTVVFALTPEGLVEILDDGGGARESHNQILLPADQLQSVLFSITQPGGNQTQTLVRLTIDGQIDLGSRVIEQQEERLVVLRNLL